MKFEPGVYTIRITWTMPDGSVGVDYDELIIKESDELKLQVEGSARFFSRGCVEGSCKTIVKFSRQLYDTTAYHTDVPIVSVLGTEEVPIQDITDDLN